MKSKDVSNKKAHKDLFSLDYKRALLMVVACNKPILMRGHLQLYIRVYWQLFLRLLLLHGCWWSQVWLVGEETFPQEQNSIRWKLSPTFCRWNGHCYMHMKSLHHLDSTPSMADRVTYLTYIVTNSFITHYSGFFSRWCLE